MCRRPGRRGGVERRLGEEGIGCNPICCMQNLVELVVLGFMEAEDEEVPRFLVVGDPLEGGEGEKEAMIILR